MLFHDINVCPPVRLSISHSLHLIMKQVEYQCFADLHTQRIDPLYNELCLIISEIFVMNPETLVKVNGSLLQACLVKEVYERLRNDHVQLVFTNFQDVACRVYNKKAYLRTALYNSVFEIESHFVNSFHCN